MHIHRLRLNSEHYSRRTQRAPLSFITSHKVRERESVHSFTVTPSKLSNNMHVKFRTSGSIDVIFLNKDSTGVSLFLRQVLVASVNHVLFSLFIPIYVVTSLMHLYLSKLIVLLSVLSYII